jgi:hypothetical protein
MSGEDSVVARLPKPESAHADLGACSVLHTSVDYWPGITSPQDDLNEADLWADRAPAREGSALEHSEWCLISADSEYAVGE